jgi:HPt (histidine-containing phosphotransfer) domain-containing protein
MDEYVSKPIRPEELAAAIARSSREPADAAAPAVAPPESESAIGAGTVPDPPPPIDRLALLTSLGGDEEALEEVTQIFLEDGARQIRAMDEALAAGDVTTLRRLAHSLKGASGTAGAVALQQASWELEQAAATGELEAAGASVQSVRDLFAAVERTMSGWLARGERR